MALLENENKKRKCVKTYVGKKVKGNEKSL